MSKNAYLFSLQFPASECKWKLQGNSQNVVGFYRQSGNFRSPGGESAGIAHPKNDILHLFSTVPFRKSLISNNLAICETAAVSLSHARPPTALSDGTELPLYI